MEVLKVSELITSVTSTKRQRLTTIIVAITLLIIVWTTQYRYHQQGAIQRELSKENQDSELVVLSAIDPKPVINDRVAALIETRQIPTLIPVLLHFASVLGREWPVVLFTNGTLLQNITSHPSIQRHSDQISIRALPSGLDFETHGSVSRFLTEAWFWEQLAPADHVFLFQTDSMICANAPTSINDFLDYDFVGAPIDNEFGKGYNGGFSLRNRPKIMQVISKHNWDEEKGPITDDGYRLDYEDQWLAYHLEQLPNSNLPTAETAKRFSVETWYPDREKGEPMPLGLHQITRFVTPDQLDEVREWCPEISLMIGKDPRFESAETQAIE